MYCDGSWGTILLLPLGNMRYDIAFVGCSYCIYWIVGIVICILSTNGCRVHIGSAVR